jgi:hypothetical protein|tara:strand:+ start:5000 stop:5233 length:234 start_codon:yes stop_codon:yes gene_type:complete
MNNQGKAIHLYMGICFKENIKIYPIIYDRNNFKIQIDYDGRIKTGKELYRVTTDQKKMQTKIIELYYEIGDKIQGRK